MAKATGVSAATLRAWERRYGVPAPQRTQSAYRLYSDEDIAIVRAMRDHCDSGLAPAQAARAVLEQREHEKERRDKENAPSALESGGVDALTQQRILDAVRDDDPARVSGEIRRAMLLGSANDVFRRVFAPVLRAIGDAWHEGALDIAQEHMASELILGACKELARLVQPARGAPLVLLACSADETHALPLYGLAFRWAQLGARTTILGARTPPSAIAHSLSSMKPEPKLVGLSTTFVDDDAALAALMPAYGEACGDTPWAVGGMGAARVRGAVEAAGGLFAETDNWEEALAPLVFGGAGRREA